MQLTCAMTIKLYLENVYLQVACQEIGCYNYRPLLLRETYNIELTFAMTLKAVFGECLPAGSLPGNGKHHDRLIFKHCNTAPRSATQCNTVLHSLAQCNIAQHNAAQCNTQKIYRLGNAKHYHRRICQQCNTPHHITPHCTTLQHTATH